MTDSTRSDPVILDDSDLYRPLDGVPEERAPIPPRELRFVEGRTNDVWLHVTWNEADGVTILKGPAAFDDKDVAIMVPGIDEHVWPEIVAPGIREQAGPEDGWVFLDALCQHGGRALHTGTEINFALAPRELLPALVDAQRARRCALRSETLQAIGARLRQRRAERLARPPDPSVLDDLPLLPKGGAAMAIILRKKPDGLNSI